MLQQSGVPGMAVAVVHDDALVFAGGFGVRELGKDAAIDADTVFQLASVSKSLAATVVSSVVGDGTVAWESRMADIAPGFALHDAWPTQNVSLADLFAHRSGLLDHAGDLLEDLGFDREEVLHRLRYLEPAYSFREGYEYTNFGLTAAAVAVAEAVGTTWEDLSAERLYQPAGHDAHQLALCRLHGRAQPRHPTRQGGDTWVVTPMQRDPDAQSPAGGVSSTARELAQWVRLQLGQGSFEGQQLIPAAALAPMHLPQAVSNVPQDPATQRAGFYGLGINVCYTDFGAVQWSHSGAFASGAATAYYLLPGSGFGVLALTNGSPVGAPEALCLSVLDLATTGDVTRDWLAVVAPRMAAAMDEDTYGTGSRLGQPASRRDAGGAGCGLCGHLPQRLLRRRRDRASRGRSGAADRTQAARVPADPLRPRHLFLAAGGGECRWPQRPFLPDRRGWHRLRVPRRLPGRGRSGGLAAIRVSGCSE